MTTPASITRTVAVDDMGQVRVTITERGEGQPFLVLHGGAGPQSVTGFAELLASSQPARVIVPTHPGFGGTSRPEDFDSMSALAHLYTGLLEDLDLTGVTVIGNFIGGWIAAEIALLGSPRSAATMRRSPRTPRPWAGPPRTPRRSAGTPRPGCRPESQ
jgi:pimeloyl-ACP methyl ester carboxylesterase